MGLLYGENCMILTSTVFDWSTRVTDRRTDGIAIAYARLAYMLSRAKMILNFSKNKEIVFRRPYPKRGYLSPWWLDGIEQVDHIRYLGVIIQQCLSFELHVQSVLRQCSQRLYLLKMLLSQGIPPSEKLHIIFTGIVMARILYAMPASGTHLNEAQTGRISAFLKRAYKCGFSAELLAVEHLYCRAQPPASSTKWITQPIAFTTFFRRLLSIHREIVNLWFTTVHISVVEKVLC